jgi:hypothetical protein
MSDRLRSCIAKSLKHFSLNSAFLTTDGKWGSNDELKKKIVLLLNLNLK